MLSLNALRGKVISVNRKKCKQKKKFSMIYDPEKIEMKYDRNVMVDAVAFENANVLLTVTFFSGVVREWPGGNHNRGFGV